MQIYTAPPREPGSFHELAASNPDLDTAQLIGAHSRVLAEYQDSLAAYHRTDVETLHRAHFDYSQNPPRIVLP